MLDKLCLTHRSLMSFRICKRYHSIRIGCASGFWGDTAVSTPQLLHGKPDVNYIVYDFLSEITMSLLARMKAKDPKLGFCSDFVSYHMAPYIRDIKSKGVKIITNAGGLNPISCADFLRKAAKSKGVDDLKIGVITGDDILPMKSKYLKVAINQSKDDKATFDDERNWVSMNVYFGAGPIAKALELGADIVITGRCTDSSMVLGPLMHEFKWKHNDWDRLATGSVAGHLIECGAQVTGGIFTDWEKTQGSWHNIGFPIVEFDSKDEKSFLLTKPKGTGGLVSFGTVAEQLVYEIDDPENYILPDVVVDMSNVVIEEITGPKAECGEVVKVSCARGKPALNHYKVSATAHEGFRCTAVCPVMGPKGEKKARATAEAILKRCSAMFEKLGLPDFVRSNIHVIGSEQSYGHNALYSKDIRECVLWLAVEHMNKDALELFSREIAPAATGMAPGLTTIVGGRPVVSPILRLHNFLTTKNIEAQIIVDGQSIITYRAPASDVTSVFNSPNTASATSSQRVQSTDTRECKLMDIAFARSGDKGDIANIGVICREKKFYPILREQLTEDIVRRYFAHFLNDSSTVKRYDLPGIAGFNFVLTNALGGGGIGSLRIDPQGKGYAQMLLDLNIPIPR